MRAIAEEAFAMVREYKGSHSGEHGDGLVRSEHHEAMFGPRIIRAFEEVKDTFDPTGLFNPGKIVRPSKMDDRSLFRFKPGYRQLPLDAALDWSEWGSFASAVEMCNNNGACRKSDPGVMCPSYRATGDEQHLTRGRANTLRLALSGQLGPDALVSEEMRETMALCVSCKGCKRECPTGVDMARMKIEFLHHYRERHGLSAARPRSSPTCRAMRPMPRASRRSSICATGCRPWRRSASACCGLSARRQLPEWSSQPYRGSTDTGPAARPQRHAARRHLQPLFRARERRSPPSGSWRAPAIGSRRPSRRSAGRYAAAAPFSPPAWSTKRRRRRGACSTRWPRRSPRGRRSSASNRPAS